MQIPVQAKPRLWVCILAVMSGAICSSLPMAAADFGPSLTYITHEWQSEEGLPSQVVQALAQTKDGYFWVGTREGLARFDGIQFTTFGSNSMPEIKSDIINALCADRNGALWIGTEGGGVTRLKDGLFTHLGKSDGLAGDIVRTILQGKDGCIWIGTLSGISRYKDGLLLNYNRDYSHKEETLLSDFINAVYEDREGVLWIASAGGVNRLEKDGRITYPGGPKIATRAIAEDKDGNIWVASNNGLIKYQKGKEPDFFSKEQGLSHNFVRSVFVDQENNVWAGSDGGLDRWDGSRFNHELKDEGVPYDQVNAFFEDREDNLWIGSKEGLIRLTPKRFNTYTTKQGLLNNNIMSVLEDRAGNMWIGTHGGLNELSDGKFVVCNGINRELITATAEGRDGSLWVGAEFDGGVTHMKDGKGRLITSNDTRTNGGVLAICEDRAGSLWIGMTRGLCRYRNGNFKIFTTNEGFPGELVKTIIEDHAGTLWIGSDGGLSRWTNGQFVTLTTKDGLSRNTVFSLYEDTNNVLWVGTQGGGLNWMRDGKVVGHCGTREGLFNDDVFTILEDDLGYLWMSCLKGIYRVSKKQLSALEKHEIAEVTSITYGRAEGLISIQYNGVAKPSGWKSRDGRLWFASTKGLIVADRDIKVNETPPPVFIEQVLADRKPMLRWPANRDTVLQIPPGSGEMEFQYTALSLKVPGKNRFRYQLEGVDNGWVDGDTQRSVHYSNVRPGHYRFRVMACNGDGTWNTAGALLAFEALPYFWQTWWFQGLVAFTGICIIGGTARHLTKQRMERQLQLLERKHEIEKERSRIAQDMHDELGARLTEIMLVSDHAQEMKSNGEAEKVGPSLGKISRLARAVVGNLDTLVWTVNPRNDSVDKLATYISEYTQNFLEACSIRCRFDVPHDLPGSPLSSEARHNVLLTVKEALNNAAKHSRCTEISLQLQMNSDRLRITIQDNGQGFERTTVTSTGNGLQSMEKRMRNIGGTFVLTGGPGKGTRIELEIPTNINAGRHIA